MQKEYNLNRFIDSQMAYYKIALNEVKNGEKKSHWMWFIFPQIKGLGKTSNSIFYSIEDIFEAREFMSNSYLKNNLLEISDAVLKSDKKSAYEIFESDAIKLKSSMTLFKHATPDFPVFNNVLVKYYKGTEDIKTIELLQQNASNSF